MLYNPVFVNIDKEAIRETLKKIGKARLMEQCKMRNLPQPEKLSNFKIIHDKNSSLHYKYSNIDNKLEYSEVMILKNYEIPVKGWQVVFGYQKALRFNE